MQIYVSCDAIGRMIPASQDKRKRSESGVGAGTIEGAGASAQGEGSARACIESGSSW